MARTINYCSSCRHWEAWEGSIMNLGACHRYPPTVVAGSPDTPISAAPLPAMDYWCGEWSAIPAPKKKKAADPEKDPNITRLIKFYAETFKEVYKSKPHVSLADSGHAKTVLEGRDFEDAAWIVREFLEEPPKWNADNGTLGMRFIPAAINTILARRK